MDLIIGHLFTPLNSSRTMGRVRWRDENSCGKVQKVRADSSLIFQLTNEGKHLFDFSQYRIDVARTEHVRIGLEATC